MAQRLVCRAVGEIGWVSTSDREPGPDEIAITPEFGVEKHGTMAAFIKGYANQRGGWDSTNRLHVAEGILWNYPVPLGNMQFGRVPSGEWVSWWGPFEDRAIVRSVMLRPLGHVEWKDAAMQDPGEFGLGALRDSGMRIGDAVAVFGLGAIGLATIQLARAAGASKVIAIDPIESRRSIANQFGAIAIDPTGADVGLLLREMTSMRGVDVVVDFSGVAAALQSAFRGIAYGGTIAYGAFPAPFGAGLDLGGEAHMNRPRVIFSRACSDPNPDHPRWNEERIRAEVWRMIQSGSLKGTGIVDEPVAFRDLAQVYPDIALHPQNHVKLSVDYH